MNHKLTHIICCPECGNKNLAINNDTNQLECNNCSQHYKIIDNVLVMLSDKAEGKTETSDIHKKYGTTFSYIDHYEKDAELFDYYQKRHGATKHRERRLREFISSKVPKKKGKILDVGCGSAWVAKTFCPKGYEVISMDISLKNTTLALKNYTFENHMAVVADAYSLPFADNSVDYIIASEIIEHTPIPERFIQNLFRVLKPGGELIVTTPYKEKLVYSLCIHCNRQTPHNAHLHSFDEDKLLALYQGKNLDKCTYTTFGNKILVHLRTHVILKFFGFKSWKLIDRIANYLYNSPETILVKWKKVNPGIRWNF